ncbi:MAG TPA: helix-turn-helix domain-containing protein [Puia sp.]|nr:helix-turn-helix domain-containing protein [Puia sp.]
MLKVLIPKGSECVATILLSPLTLYIKNMVSSRCIIVVRDELANIALSPTRIELGEVEFEENLSFLQIDQIRTALKNSGFELLDDRKSILVQRIKNIIINLVHYPEERLTTRLSKYLSEKLNYDYTYLSNLFSERQGNTIEKFYILHKIERVKELLTYHELTLTQIASKMNYRSLAHLSTQFKKVTGLTVTEFKHLKEKRRTMLDDL